MDRLNKFVCVGVASGLVMALSSAAALAAQSNPSAESCEDLGMLDVQCYNCKTGEYLGKINVQAGYDTFHKACLRSRSEARSRCSGAYGVPEDNIGMKWQYRIGMTDWKNWSPRNNGPWLWVYVM